MPATRKGEYSVEETLTETGERCTAGSAPEVVAPHLFVALECDRPAAGVARHSLANIDGVVIARGSVRDSERMFDGGTRTLVIRIPDPHMSARHACLVRSGANFSADDLGSRNGTRVNDTRVVAPTPLADGDVIQVGHTLLRYRTAVASPIGEPADFDSSNDSRDSPLMTVDPALYHRAIMLGRVARSTAPVLLLGATGTGKDVLARAIHRLSGRKGPFVGVNCGAIPATLVEAQLFGHVRGAFSGAVGDAPGLLRSADGGTLLLDEIGDLPAPAQATLLRVLQEHEVVPIGSVRAVKIDLRVVAATHQPLDQMAARGTFREDLLARLTGFTFALPPVHARPEDIGLFIAAFAMRRPIAFTPVAGYALLRHDWPLNVRELHHTLDIAATLANDGTVDLLHLPPAVGARGLDPSQLGCEPLVRDSVYDQLVASLARHGGNVSHVARELGKARTQVQRWMKRYQVEARSFRKP